MPDLKNEDYFPNQPFSESRTAWGDPIFSGAGAQFPMAAYDAQRKARAQAELDEAKSNIMQLKIPEIDTGAYAQRFKTGFIDEVSSLTNDYVKRYGNSKKAIQAMRQDGSLANLQAKFEGIAKSIDQTAGRAKDFLKGAQEKASTMYYSPEGVRAATNFMNGMDAYAKGLITPEQLNQLEQQFNTAQRWDDYKEKALNDFTDDEVVPGLMGDKLSPEEEIEYQKQLNLPGGLKDKRHFLVVKKYSQANKGKIIEGIVKPFFDTNRTAFEQLKQGSETKEETIDRVARGIVAMRGNKIFEDVISESQDKGVNITNVMGGTPSTETGFYYNTAVAQPQIKEYLTSQFEAVRSGKMTPKQALQEAYKLADKSGSWIADNTYMRVTTPGKWASIKEEVNPIPYSEMFIPTQSGGFQPYDAKTATGNANESANTQPAHSVILDTERAWMIPDGDGFKMISQEQYKKLGMPESAISYRIDKVNTYRTIDDFKESGGAKDPKTGQWVISPELMKTGSKNAGKIAYQIYPETVEGISDLDVMGSKDTKTKSSGPGKATKISVSKSVENL
jgi:hypothetical protein